MEPLEAIVHLAKQEARHLTPLRSLEEVNKTIPYFCVTKNDDKKYTLQGFNAACHDNADRLPWFLSYMSQQVLPNVDSAIDVSGYYQIELHDTYVYLDNGKDYTNTLTWSKHKGDSHVVLLPDCYNIAGYGGRFEAATNKSNQDTTPWQKKQSKIAFFGTTTGDRDPLKNKRIQTALWALEHREYTDIYITRVAQIDHSIIAKCVPRFREIYRAPTQEDELFKYKYALDIPGNTCSWDRVPAIMNSRSLLFKAPCDDMCTYYPLLHAGEHYVSVNSYNMQNQFLFYENNPDQAQFITKCANKFRTQYMNGSAALAYTVALFEEACTRNKA